MTADLTAAELQAAPSSDEWSVNDVLAHLRACADVWGGHFLAILAEDKTTRQGINPRTWIKQTNYLDLKFRPSFRAFTQQRAELLAIAQSVPEDAWSRTAMVMAWGMANERTALVR